MHNPWSGYRVTGTWLAHSSYSLGGTDWPLPYGTALRAPAAGRLVNNGWVGSAGRRATLRFDAPVKRLQPASSRMMLGGYREHDCDMVAFVFQHARGYLGDGHYAEGALVGFSGASANGLEWGGDAHLHGHGLCVHGQRVDFLKFVGASTAGGGYVVIGESSSPVEVVPEEVEDDDMTVKLVGRAAQEGGGIFAVGKKGRRHLSPTEYGLMLRFLPSRVVIENGKPVLKDNGTFLTVEMDMIKHVLAVTDGDLLSAEDVRAAVEAADLGVGELVELIKRLPDETVAKVVAELGDRVPVPEPEPEPEVPVVTGPSHVIDVAWPQASGANGGKPFPFAEAKAAGVDAVIVKASGYNVKPLYVADGYREHVDGARAAGLPVGHYFVVGAGDPVAQADWFVDNLHDYRKGDVLALDNEPLDSNAAFWLQDDVAKWVARVIERTGANADRIWVYFPASATRTNKPWDKVEAAGVRRWWAAYGSFPTGWEPDHEPSLQGSLTGWDAHQYTSKFAVAGRSVDCSFSPLPITDLFG